jgi:ABC-type Fe3+-siderophore transport system permease subunit
MSTVAAVLAGFSLAIIGVLLTTNNRPTLSESGVALFVAAALFFIHAMQFVFSGLLYAMSPTDRIAWLPCDETGTVLPSAFRGAERVQAQDKELERRYFMRAGICYFIGMASFISGIGVILVSPNLGVLRMAALGTVILALFLQLLWAAGNLSRRARLGWLMPSYDRLAEEGFPGTSTRPPDNVYPD